MFWVNQLEMKDGQLVVVPLSTAEPSKRLNSPVQFFEPRQNALIAWNGVEEILFLTTDVAASRASKVLEVLPLPAQPRITKGNFKTLDTANEVIASKLPHFSSSDETGTKDLILRGFGDVAKKQEPPAAVIVQHDQVGSHEVSVVQVLNPAKFVSWTEANLRRLGSPSPHVPPWMRDKIQQYTKNGFNWFAFDVVDLQTQMKSIEPLRYRFSTKKLFYPLQITRVTGSSDVKLVVMTSRPISKFDNIPGAQISYPHGTFYVTRTELDKIDPEMRILLSDHPRSQPLIGVWNLHNSNGVDYQSDLFGHFSAQDYVRAPKVKTSENRHKFILKNPNTQ